MARPGPSRGQLHVGRYFFTLLLLFAALYTTVIFAGKGSAWLKPKLGLDLKGGAQVILTPKLENGKKPSSSELSASVDILRQRVDGQGVSAAEIVIQGSQIIVSVPGGNRDAVSRVTQAAQMEFRRVLEETTSTPSVTTSPTSTTVPTPTAGASTPKPTATTSKRVLSQALTAAATPSPSPSATPSPAATPSASPSAAQPTLTSGAIYSAANYALLDCSDPRVRSGGTEAPHPKDEIVACSKDGTLKFHLAKPEVFGKDISSASPGTDQIGNNVVNISWKSSAQSRWTKMTQETLTGTHPSPTDQIAITLDGVVISNPQTQSVINGDTQISGNFTQQEAQDLSNNLKFGALPVSFQPSSTQLISPSLGDDQLKSGLLAGGLGLIAVVLYSLLYYRALGFVTIASLGVSAGLVYGSICVLGQQLGLALTLPGIAGFIVAVGITADSFVVYFERLKDEIKEGRTPRSAVDRAWVRARRTIINADAVSLLAAVVLYAVSVGDVRGFAFTLGLSTLLDLAVVFLFTRPLISWLARFRWFSRSRLTGFYGPDGGDPLTSARRAPLAAQTTAEPLEA
ncbi:MAG: preprotein translocase subunit SecD [Frankiales bacterium]|nr:preprotein translocase subunit SecD [Frankiales bacterium]